MKELAQKQKHIYPLYKQFNETVKEIFMCLLYIFIFVSCYYICICACSININNCELITVYNTNFVESKSVDQSNIWYKYILDDFFNKFTSNSKTINYKNIEIKSDRVLKTLWFEHNLEIGKKPVILDKIKSYHMDNLISECEFYKNKASLLEIQLLKAKVSYQDLIKDINDIMKEMNDSSKKP